MRTLRIAVDGDLTLAADAYGPDAHGPDRAPLVVLGHGGGQTRHSWDKAGRELGAAGYRVLNYDLLGHGESDWEPAGDYSFERRAADLGHVAAQASGPFALVGASLGGLAAMVAVAQGLRPRALVLVDVVPRLAPAGVERIVAFMTAHPAGFASLQEAADAVSAYYPDRPRPDDPSGLARNLRQGADGRLRWHWDPRFLRTRADQEGFARLVEGTGWGDAVPTLLVRGMKSDIVTDEGVAHLRELVPGLEVADIAGAGHMVAGDRNDRFNAVVLAFLQRTMPLAAAPAVAGRD